MPSDCLWPSCAAQHWDPRIAQLCEDRGTALVYLPRYSPEFSPIELAFGWLKKRLRRKRLQRSGRLSAHQIALFVLDSLPELPAPKMRNFCRRCWWDVASAGGKQRRRQREESHRLHTGRVRCSVQRRRPQCWACDVALASSATHEGTVCLCVLVV